MHKACDCRSTFAASLFRAAVLHAFPELGSMHKAYDCHSTFAALLSKQMMCKPCSHAFSDHQQLSAASAVTAAEQTAMMESMLPVAIGEDLAADVLGNHSSALQVHEHTADGGLLGALQLLLTHLACYCLQAPHRSSSC